MKAIDLRNGIRRAIHTVYQPSSTQCPRRRPATVARFHASLPVRTFSSSNTRRASEQAPKQTTSNARISEIESGIDVSTNPGLEDTTPFRAAPEINLDGLEDFEASPQTISTLSAAESREVSAAKDVDSPGKRAEQSFYPSSSPTSPDTRQRAGGVSANSLRVVPASPSYFTARPNFTDHYLSITSLYRRHQLLPTTNRSETKITWLTLPEYRELIGNEPVAPGRFRDLIRMCGRLAAINPHLMPDEVHTVLQSFMKEEQPIVRFSKKAVVDECGRAYGLGRRKAATARAWIVRGKGEVLVNGKSLSQYFSRLHQRESALYALSVTDRVGDYNVFAIVEGGGTTGQAEALTLAVAKALIVYEPALKMRLKSAGCLTRDRRRVERKKPGHLKARKKPAWVKR
ncbi:uncharacterized protein PV09_08656 [Verruconis gallopava]|uniref:Small ribosomal subunit protein uS9m n=1 Tax=Verruconis gallopava TaxID=253628 RepID=A0A0D1YG33_9PEZI|nr:uncharacterized protein PV09_08656 [Verruconis gallopava]KIV99726.1 hypothetical protein PV09_08656 [Verruconis gallopava]